MSICPSFQLLQFLSIDASLLHSPKATLLSTSLPLKYMLLIILVIGTLHGNTAYQFGIMHTGPQSYLFFILNIVIMGNREIQIEDLHVNTASIMTRTQHVKHSFRESQFYLVFKKNALLSRHTRVSRPVDVQSLDRNLVINMENVYVLLAQTSFSLGAVVYLRHPVSQLP